MSPQMLSASELRKRCMAAAAKKNDIPFAPDTSVEEIRHQEAARLQKQRLERELEEQERLRKAALAEDLRHAAQAKRDRAEREQREEEERRRTLEQRRLADRERRQRHAQKQKEWMEQMSREAEEDKRKRLEVRQHLTEERRTRPLPLRPVSVQDADVTYAGWVTVQTSDSVAWKRRYCRVNGEHIVLLKDDKPVCVASMFLFNGRYSRCPHQQAPHVAHPIPIVSILRVCERGDGLEELECLPHSFAVCTADGVTWSMFTDNEDEKVR